jgi:hypothetical protein
MENNTHGPVFPPNSGHQIDDFIDKDGPDRMNGYTETERLFITGYTGEYWEATWHPNPANPYGGGPYMCTYSNGGLYETTDHNGDSLDIYDVGEVLSPWSNTASHKWTGSTFSPTTIGIEISSFSSINQTYNLKVRLTNPEDLAPSKPYLSWDPRDLGKPYEQGWVYLAWGADFWDEQPIEPDITWSELQRKIGFGSWQTVYSGPYRVWEDGSINYDPNGETPVYFRVRWKDSQNKWSLWSDLFSTKMNNGSIGVGQKSISQSPDNRSVLEYGISQNYPNPFNPVTTITFSIKESGLVSLKVFDVLGKEVITLIKEFKPEGDYKTRFDASDLPSGIYFYTLQVNEFIENRKMLLLK